MLCCRSGAEEDDILVVVQPISIPTWVQITGITIEKTVSLHRPFCPHLSKGEIRKGLGFVIWGGKWGQLVATEKAHCANTASRVLWGFRKAFGGWDIPNSRDARNLASA